jgi:hypothetical protein
VIWETYGIWATRVNQNGVVLDTTGISLSSDNDEYSESSVVFDGINYFVIWQDNRNNSSNIYAAKINTAGEIIDTFVVSTQQGEQYSPALVKGANNQTFVIYTGWTRTYQGRIYNALRVWGKFYPVVGIDEKQQLFFTQNKLLQIYPNPFTNLATIHYVVPVSGIIKLRLYSITGRLIQTLYGDYHNAGIYMTKLSAKSLAKGVYFLRYEATNNRIIETKFIVL